MATAEGGQVMCSELASTVSMASPVALVEAGKLKEKDLTAKGSSVMRSVTMHQGLYT